MNYILIRFKSTENKLNNEFLDSILEGVARLTNIFTGVQKR